MPKVLVETSVWVSFFRGSSSVYTDQLAELLQNNGVSTTSIIRAELLSGTRTESEYRALGNMLSAIERLSETVDFRSELLQNNGVSTTSIIRAELLSGTRTESEYRALGNMLSAIERLSETVDF